MLPDLLREYRDLNPETGEHDCPRTLREYARLLGVSHAALIQVMGGQREAGGKVMRGLMRAFPNARPAISDAIAADPTAETPEPELAEVS